MLNKLKYKKFGEYKVYYKMKKIIMLELFDLIRQNVEIENKGKGEVEFKLNNVNKILEYEINNITNINKKTNYKYSFDELIKLNDLNINNCIVILEQLLKNGLEEYKNIVLKDIEEKYKIQQDIENIAKSI